MYVSIVELSRSPSRYYILNLNRILTRVYHNITVSEAGRLKIYIITVIQYYVTAITQRKYCIAIAVSARSDVCINNGYVTAVAAGQWQRFPTPRPPGARDLRVPLVSPLALGATVLCCAVLLYCGVRSTS